QYEIPAGLIICDARFWRVRAVKTGEPGPWSESRSVEIAVSSSPKLIGQLDSSDGFTGNPIGMAIKGNYAIVGHTSGVDQMSVVNISDPGNPTLVTTFEHSPGQKPKLTGDYLYCYVDGGTEESIIKVDVSDPENPVQVGNPCSLKFDPGLGSGTLDYNANIYLDNSGGGSGLLVAVYDQDTPTSAGIMQIDFSDHFTPVVDGMFMTTDDQPFAIEQAATTGLVSIRGEGVQSFSLIGQDVSDSYGIENMGFGHIEIGGNYAFVSNMDGPLTILDISNPSSLSLVYTYDPGEGTGPSTVFGNYLFTGLATSQKFTILDIRDPSAPVLVSEGNMGWIATVIGNYAYGVEWTTGKFTIWDLLPED
uniref:LVIVD repeat-containing protein n=1 Tax=Oceanispirochaeta sp. TaxID=2035350 RepID=UPI00260BB712